MFPRERLGMREASDVCMWSGVCFEDKSLRWVSCLTLGDLSVHIQPLVEIYRLPVVCISATTAWNLAVMRQKRNAAKASGQTGVETQDHLLCAALKVNFHILFSGKL